MKMRFIFVLLLALMLIPFVSANNWNERAFDTFSDSVVNTTKWNYAGTGTYLEANNKLNFTVLSGASAYQFINFSTFANATKLQNVKFSIDARRGTTAGGGGVSLRFYGDYIFSFGAMSSTYQNYNFSFVRNTSNINYFDLYVNGGPINFAPYFGYTALHDTKGAINLSIDATGTEFIEVVYRSINLTTNYVFLIGESPVNNSNIVSGTDSIVNATYGVEFDQLVNTSLIIDNVRVLNQSLTGMTNTTSFNYSFPLGDYDYYVEACDAADQCGQSTARHVFSGPYAINSETYRTATTEGLTETFTLNITLNPAYTLIGSSFYYNNTQYASVPTSDGTNLIFYNEAVTPLISSSTSVPFYWVLIVNNGTDTFTISIPVAYQTITESILDDCSTYRNVVVNFTQMDEDERFALQYPLYNLTFSITAETFTMEHGMVSNVSFNKTSKNSAAVCISNLTAVPYLLDVTVKYGVVLPDTYVLEYYNIQSFPLNSSNVPGNITLYPLLKTSSTEFLITLKDQNYNFIPNALIDIRRRFVSLGDPLSVEIPLTDPQGNAIGHFVLNDVRYDFVISKDGVVLYTFENMQPFCSNVATGDCHFTLTIPEGGVQPEDTSIPITFTINYDENLRIISIPWSAKDGEIHSLYLNVTNQFNTTEYCSGSTSDGFSGTLLCTVPQSAGNGTVILRIQEGTTVYHQSFLDLGGETIPLNALTVIGVVVLIITLILIALPAGPVVTLIMFIIGLIIAAVTGMLGRNGIIGPTSAILWFIIAAGILIWRLSKNERI